MPVRIDGILTVLKVPSVAKVAKETTESTKLQAESFTIPTDVKNLKQQGKCFEEKIEHMPEKLQSTKEELTMAIYSPSSIKAESTAFE